MIRLLAAGSAARTSFNGPAVELQEHACWHPVPGAADAKGIPQLRRQTWCCKVAP